jgi:DDE superfamily endonuclease
LPERTLAVFEDETDLLLFPPLRSGWGKRGERVIVPLSGANARRVIFGTINIRTGHRVFLIRRKQRGEDFREFLWRIHRHYRGWRVALILDEDPSHTAHASLDLAGWLDIELLWLPKRCPELNAMDHLWGHGKDHVCANRQYESIDAEANRFIDYLHGLSNHDALLQAGILSEDFWLYQ